MRTGFGYFTTRHRPAPLLDLTLSMLVMASSAITNLIFLSKTETEKAKLQRDAKYYKYSRHFSTIVLCLIFITIYFSSLVAAAMEATPLVKALMVGLPTVTVWTWVNGKLKKKDEDIKNT
ncbi:hypothetical protein HanXRQr2_Chr09g0365341 [Helianthus annuus]|uniref:Uncharacterized protein n=1 Tax=Helianthus annuus TaxID=4232 RepID=A0A9K3I2F2_HELAN|nr:hypothetical protein HanXRQr2_Chr09g0365341 [Helianthus annuus]